MRRAGAASDLFAGIQVGQHVLLDAANRGAGHLKLAAPAGRQFGRQGSDGRRLERESSINGSLPTARR